MFFVKNTTEERRRKLQGEKRKQQAVCRTYVFFGTKSFASSRAFSCTKTRERKTAAGIATYWQLTIHKNRPLYISVPLRLLSWCSNTKLFVRKGERNEWWHASTPAQGGVGPSFGGACHACSHWIQSTVCMYIFLCKIDKKVNMVSGFSILSILLEMMNLYKHVDKNIYGFRN